MLVREKGAVAVHLPTGTFRNPALGWSRYRGENPVPQLVRHTDKGRKEMFYLTTHSTHFIYGHMASDIW